MPCKMILSLTRSMATLSPAFLGAAAAAELPFTFSVGADPVEILTSNSKLFGLPVSDVHQVSIRQGTKNGLTSLLVGGDNTPLLCDSTQLHRTPSLNLGGGWLHLQEHTYIDLSNYENEKSQNNTSYDLPQNIGRTK